MEQSNQTQWSEVKEIKFHHKVKRFYHKNLFRKIYTVAIIWLIGANVFSMVKYASFADELWWMPVDNQISPLSQTPSETSPDVEDLQECQSFWEEQDCIGNDEEVLSSLPDNEDTVLDDEIWDENQSLQWDDKNTQSDEDDVVPTSDGKDTPLSEWTEDEDHGVAEDLSNSDAVEWLSVASQNNEWWENLSLKTNNNVHTKNVNINEIYYWWDFYYWKYSNSSEDDIISVVLSWETVLNVRDDPVEYGDGINTCGEWFHILNSDDASLMYENMDTELFKHLVWEPKVTTPQEI